VLGTPLKDLVFRDLRAMRALSEKVCVRSVLCVLCVCVCQRERQTECVCESVVYASKRERERLSVYMRV
jgi:hypothetical protein